MAPRSQHESHHCSGLCLLVLIGRNQSLHFHCACQQGQGTAVGTHIYVIYVTFFFTCVNILRWSMSRWILYHSVTGRVEICYEFLKQCWGLYCMYQPHVGEQIARGGGRAALCIIQWDQTERSESHKEEPIKENIKGDITPWGKALIQYVLQVTGSICSFFFFFKYNPAECCFSLQEI